DALITFEEPLLSSAGDQIKIVIEAGLTAVKPLEGSNHLTLFKLQSEQHIDLVYRGLRPESPRINAVMLRRIPSGQPASITVSMIGIPVVKEKIKLFLGSKPLTVTSVERSQDDSRIAIVKAQVPAIAAAGLYDLLAHVEFDGVSEAVTLYGALQVDAPIVFSSIEPRWGPMSCCTVITVHGEGFEPGNTVINGPTISVGSSTVYEIEVLSSNKLTFVSPRGTPGQKSVQAKDRYGRTTELSGLKGFGYGIQQLATVQASRANPVDVIVDQQTGVALTAAGYFHQGFSKKQLLEESPGASVPESWRALSFDVQEARGPILVGGVGSLPSGSEGAVEIKRYMTLQKLASKQLENEVLIDQPQLTETEKADLARLQGTYLPL